MNKDASCSHSDPSRGSPISQSGALPVEPTSFKTHKYTVVWMTSHPTLRREAESKASGSLESGLEG